MAKPKISTDRVTERVERAFRERYGAAHPRASVVAYRYNNWSIMVRVIDPDFEEPDRVTRLPLFAPVLRSLPEAVEERIGLILALTPEEARESPTSAEFDAVAKALAKKPAAAPAAARRNGTARPGRR